MTKTLSTLNTGLLPAYAPWPFIAPSEQPPFFPLIPPPQNRRRLPVLWLEAEEQSAFNVKIATSRAAP